MFINKDLYKSKKRHFKAKQKLTKESVRREQEEQQKKKNTIGTPIGVIPAYPQVY